MDSAVGPSSVSPKKSINNWMPLEKLRRRSREREEKRKINQRTKMKTRMMKMKKRSMTTTLMNKGIIERSVMRKIFRTRCLCSSTNIGTWFHLIPRYPSAGSKGTIATLKPPPRSAHSFRPT